MTKAEYIAALQQQLQGLPQQEIDHAAEYYTAIIDGALAAGDSEEGAVASVCRVEQAATHVRDRYQSTVKAQSSRRPLPKWATVLLAFTFPVWFLLLMVAITVAVVLYLVLWVLVACMGYVDLSLVLVALALLCAWAILLVTGDWLASSGFIGIALVLAGLAVFLFLGMLWAGKRVLSLGEYAIDTIQHYWRWRKGRSCF